MTHSLHRRGTRESISEDYVMIMIQAVGVNDDDSTTRRVQEYLRIVMRHNPKNIGSVSMGGMIDKSDEVIANASKIGHAVFDNKEDLTVVLKEL